MWLKNWLENLLLLTIWLFVFTFFLGIVGGLVNNDRTGFDLKWALALMGKGSGTVVNSWETRDQAGEKESPLLESLTGVVLESGNPSPGIAESDTPTETTDGDPGTSEDITPVDPRLADFRLTNCPSVIHTGEVDHASLAHAISQVQSGNVNGLSIGDLTIQDILGQPNCTFESTQATNFRYLSDNGLTLVDFRQSKDQKGKVMVDTSN